MFTIINSNNKIKPNSYIAYYNKHFYTYTFIPINISLKIPNSLCA